ncbi:site-specific DNA-methyltransferase [Leptospira sp. GIMC2001]|uniref:site-specific DNA-methyltransferase n=1 Tax=Leptospira sp. GIMC2001 TaxID=1513297 RepID=UPI00234AD894|nr:site-specific DNA-methyltransferase [Leptospira sp. GIMC2001]WCL48282.1 site-specific DNA-methyltransferase [Leptospira sp. GIMC2001]
MAEPIVKLQQDDRKQLGEFWTSKQRQSHSLHYAVSYRASFKPELPSFFFSEFLKKKGSVVFDPFGGRGTTAIQANIEGHYAIHNDVNPLSIFLAQSRQNVPNYNEALKILEKVDVKSKAEEDPMDKSLLAFYHKDTLNEIKNFRNFCERNPELDTNYLKLVALSRLHGHSPGFFSVYSFPQMSIPAEQQHRNNIKKGIKPDYRPILPRIANKLKRDLAEPLPPFYHEFSKGNRYSRSSVLNLEPIPSEIADLVVTSPPFLDKVNYELDNWIRHWFLRIPSEQTKEISIISSLEEWTGFMRDTLRSSARILKKGAFLVIEVGEVKKGNKILPLDDSIVEAGASVGLDWSRTYINTQKFTKLSNCWNVSNNEKGTNSNRCVVLQKLS